MAVALLAAACTSDEPTVTAPPVPVTDVVVEGALSDASDVIDSVKNSVVVVNNFTLEATESGGERAVQQSTGSGVVVDDDGGVITNLHVIAGAEFVTVQAVDGRQREARVVATLGLESDLALLSVEDAEGLVPIEFGSSLERKVGDGTVVVGNPVGIGLSAATGIISAGGRVIRTPEAVLYDILQTDAAINPGNSGGALLDATGALIGINTAVRGETEGIGFAIPVEQVRDFIAAVAEGRAIPHLGVGLLTLDEQLLALFGPQLSGGVGVLEVSPSSPVAGVLQRGAVITAVDGVDVRTASELSVAIEGKNAGDTVTLTVFRFDGGNGVTEDVVITLGALTPDYPEG